jgi:hypothetical protein
VKEIDTAVKDQAIATVTDLAGTWDTRAPSG